MAGRTLELCLDDEDVTLVLCDSVEPHDRDACEGCRIERRPCGCEHADPDVTGRGAGRNAA